MYETANSAAREMLENTNIYDFNYGDFAVFPSATPMALIQQCYESMMKKTVLNVALTIYPDILHQCHDNETVAAEAAVKTANLMLQEIGKLEFVKQ